MWGCPIVCPIICWYRRWDLRWACRRFPGVVLWRGGLRLSPESNPARSDILSAICAVSMSYPCHVHAVSAVFLSVSCHCRICVFSDLHRTVPRYDFSRFQARVESRAESGESRGGKREPRIESPDHSQEPSRVFAPGQSQRHIPQLPLDQPSRTHHVPELEILMFPAGAHVTAGQLSALTVSSLCFSGVGRPGSRRQCGGCGGRYVSPSPSQLQVRARPHRAR